MWPPSSNCLCEELRSNCDREHSKVVELEAEILKKQQMLNESEKRCAFIEKNHVNLQVKYQKYKECPENQRVCDNSNSTASNAIFEINKLKDQLQGKDDTIRNLQTQINLTRMLNVGSTVVRIQNDRFKVENENVKRRYKELSETNTHSRDELTGKINALTAENAKLKTELSGKKSSGSTAFEKPKVLASGMYTNSSSTFTSKKEPTGTKPATESHKPMPKSHTRNHRILPSKSVNARRAADHNRKLNVVDHNQFMIRSLKSVNTKTPQAKHSVNHTKKFWKATRNHNVNTTKGVLNNSFSVSKYSDVRKKIFEDKLINPVENATQTPPKETQLGDHWKGLLVVFKPQWKPTGATIRLYDNCPLTRIMEPIVEDLSENLPRAFVGRPVTESITRKIEMSHNLRLQNDWESELKESEELRCFTTRRTASIRKSDTSVLEDLKALSWKTCQECSLLNLSDHSSSSTTLNHPSSSHSLDDTLDENDDESFHSSSLSPSQNISSSSNVISRVRQNPPHESHNLNTYLSKTINLQTQQRDAHREGLRSIRQALKNMMGGKRK
ncbi:hypothetical protein Tco_1419398 [Tanacetum coccineum]